MVALAVLLPDAPRLRLDGLTVTGAPTADACWTTATVSVTALEPRLAMVICCAAGKAPPVLTAPKEMVDGVAAMESIRAESRDTHSSGVSGSLSLTSWSRVVQAT